MTHEKRLSNAFSRSGILLVAALCLGPATAWGQQNYMPNPGQTQYKAPKKKNEKHIPRPTSTTNYGFSSLNIAAVVDDQVILLEDVLASIRPSLEAKKKMLPPQQYKMFEEQQVQMAIRGKIQQAIIINELKRKLPKPEVMERIRSAAEADFEKYMTRIAHQNGLKSRDELVEQLKREGSDLAVLRSSFVDNMVAQQYLQSLVQPKLREPTREDMEEFYNENIDKWSQQAGVVWRNIEIKKGSDPAAARDRIDEIKRELDSGADFAAMAKSNSQSPTAAAGGLWSRTSKGSYADPAVDAAIFSVPVGQVSDVIDGKSSYHIVLVEERTDGGPKPFVEVQEQIRNRLRGQQMERVRRQIVDEFKENHQVISMFDNPAADQIQGANVIAQPDVETKLR